MHLTKKYMLPLNCIPHSVYHNTAPVSFYMGLRVDNTNILFINSSPCWFLQRRAKRGHERLTKIGNWNFNWLLKPYFSYSPYHVYQSTIRISKYFKVNAIHIIKHVICSFKNIDYSTRYVSYIYISNLVGGSSKFW